MKKNEKGFTLIELLAVIVILGLLMAIAIPSVTKYITQSRRKTLVKTIDSYITAVVNQVNDGEYKFSDSTKIFAIPIECISLEKGGTDPFGNWYQANDNYWAYVLVQYDSTNYNYKYGFTFKDDAGYGMYPTVSANIDEKGSQVKTGYDNLTKPKTGLAIAYINIDKWTGFSIESNTKLVVLKSRSEGEVGNGSTTCTLCQKGDNYEQIEEERNKSGTLINNQTSTTLVFGQELNKSQVEAIYTEDYISIPTEAIDYWDASNEQNESIMAYLLDKDNDGMYEVYLAQEKGVQAPKNSLQLFYNFTNLTEIDLSNFKTTNVTNIVEMFQNCKKLKSIDLSSFDTSSVTTMSSLFKNCESLENVNVSSFDTSKAYYMMALFQGCKSLKKVDISNFNTQNAGVMNYMFYGCTSLEEVDLSSFEPKKLLTISYMFNNCTSLKKIDMKNVDFSYLIDATQYQLTFTNVKSDILIYVKDERQKEWFNNNFSDLTNVQVYE